MGKVADLHVHTNISDSTFSPEKVVSLAGLAGLDAIAITDHDTCAGIAPAIMFAKDMDIEIIPGVELTTELEDDEVHMLGYFIDWQNKEFTKKLEELCRVREERAKEILRRLSEQGIDLQYEDLLKLAGPGMNSVGRLHIANLLYAKGKISCVRDAFTKYIGNNSPAYVKKFKLSPREASDMIKSVGGVSVLAHPKTINTENRPLRDTVGMLVGEGVQGIEAYHSDHNARESNEFKALAKEYGLLVTGGSDCHGLGKKEVLLGKVKVSYELVEKLRDASRLKQYE
ncbi:MAG: PHP domain-containing protein [Candidatus Omnitrophota bacterium]|nr:PHP domain-containing protein [Candidatus Omnitrophota bacterium]